MSCEQRCSGCAFTPGTEANREPNNHLRALICLLGPSPFWCHANIDWRAPRPHKVSLKEYQILAQTAGICRGWQEAVRELAATGYYQENPIVTKYVGLAALDQLDLFLAKDVDPEIKEDAGETLKRLVKLLGKKRRKFEGEKNG